MTQTAPTRATPLAPAHRTRPIDIGDALDLLATARSNNGNDNVKRHNGQHATDDGHPQSLIEDALLEAGVTHDQLQRLRGHRLRDLYREARLPLALTLGGLIVLDAAQRSEDRGFRGDDVLDDATAAAARFLDLVALAPKVTEFLRPYRRGRQGDPGRTTRPRR